MRSIVSTLSLSDPINLQMSEEVSDFPPGVLLFHMVVPMMDYHMFELNFVPHALLEYTRRFVLGGCTH